MLSAKKVQICSSANHSTFILWYIEALFIYSIDWFFVESWHIEGCTTYKMTSDFRWFPTEITKIRYHKICCYHIFTRNYAIISLSITSKKYAEIGNFLYSKSPINRSHINLFQTIPMIWLQYFFLLVFLSGLIFWIWNKTKFDTYLDITNFAITCYVKELQLSYLSNCIT